MLYLRATYPELVAQRGMIQKMKKPVGPLPRKESFDHESRDLFLLYSGYNFPEGLQNLLFDYNSLLDNCQRL